MWLFQESANEGHDQMEEALPFAQLCCVNLEMALLNLPLHLPADTTMILALVLGVSTFRVALYSKVADRLLGILRDRNLKTLLMLDSSI